MIFFLVSLIHWPSVQLQWKGIEKNDGRISENVNHIKRGKSSYVRSVKESFICFTDEQDAERAIVEMKKYRVEKTELCQNCF